LKLLWLELKKLGHKVACSLALLILVLAILGTNLGASTIFSEPVNGSINDPHQLNGSRLIHLQLFGGLIHFHDSSFENHLEGHQHNKTHSFEGASRVNGNSESLYTNLIYSKLLNNPTNTYPEQGQPFSRVINQDDAHSPQVFSAVPQRPPVK
jgi:hypothetical protein